jgi:hypothetical protein
MPTRFDIERLYTQISSCHRPAGGAPAAGIGEGVSPRLAVPGAAEQDACLSCEESHSELLLDQPWQWPLTIGNSPWLPPAEVSYYREVVGRDGCRRHAVLANDLQGGHRNSLRHLQQGSVKEQEVAGPSYDTERAAL